MGITGLLPQAGPVRVLAVSTFINTVGNGLFMAAAAIFFTRSVGLSVREVGLLIAAACVLFALAGTPGWLLLAGLFVAAGALMPPVTRWAQRDRPHGAAHVVTPSST